ncbi:hypothetical protein [Streptococcus gallolyticus]|uniref:hypothetical protein n=1 Tax=Streptococcus gallolyticus TaxID=315405 RepID=UPI000777E96A|nr:hypothetical protein [Streptococcus gallolyticus]
MKKKLLAILLAVMSVFLLVACSSKTEKMEGTYYRYGTSSNTGELFLSSEKISISGGTLFDESTNSQYSINEDDKTATGSNGTLSYSYSDDVLTLDGDTYVKTGTDKYDEIYEEAHENDGDD